MSRSWAKTLFSAMALCFGLVAFALAAEKPLGQWEAVEVSQSPLAFKGVQDDQGQRYGKLVFEGGITFSSQSHPFFGGFSGLSLSSDGKTGYAITDEAQLFHFELATENGRLRALKPKGFSRLYGPSGAPLDDEKYSSDSEGLSLSSDGQTAYIGFERNGRVLAYTLDQTGYFENAQDLPLPRAILSASYNKGIETVVSLKSEGYKGGLLIMLEKPLERLSSPQGWLVRPFGNLSFPVPETGAYAITDAGEDNRGNLYLLERQFLPLLGPKLRIRRFRLDDLVAGYGAGDVLLEAGWPHMIDNFEGLAVHQEGGKTYLTLISDNNFSLLQRTLMLRFSIAQ